MKELKLTNTNKVALVDDADYEMVSKHSWRLHKRGYVVCGVSKSGKQRTLRLHRVIMGVTDPKIEVDHINQDKLDNTRKNLRLCTRQNNSFNRGKYKKNASSQYVGVHYRADIKRWAAAIMYNYKAIYIGVFKQEKDAALAYNKKAKELFGKFACLNQIEEPSQHTHQ